MRSTNRNRHLWLILKQCTANQKKKKVLFTNRNIEMQTFTPPLRRIEFEPFNEIHWMSLSDVFFHKFQFPRTLKNCCGCCLQYLTSVIEYSWHRLNVFLALNVKWMWYKFQGKQKKWFRHSLCAAWFVCYEYFSPSIFTQSLVQFIVAWKRCIFK